MPLERLTDDDKDWVDTKPCLNKEHNPPMHIVLRPGTYRHTCPGCGRKQTFTVPAKIC